MRVTIYTRKQSVHMLRLAQFISNHKEIESSILLQGYILEDLLKAGVHTGLWSIFADDWT